MNSSPTGPIGQTLSLGASYAGGAAGQGIEDIVRDEQRQGFGEAVGRYHQAGMKGLQDELIGGPIAKVFEKIVAPFGGKLSPQDKAVAEYAAAKKLPMAPSDIFPSRTAKMVEWIGDSLLLGKAVGDIRRKQLGRNIEKIIDNTSKDLNFLTDKGTAGATLGGAIKEARKDLKEKTGEAYSKFTSIAEALDAGMNEEIKRTGTVKKPLEMSNFIETANKWRYQIDNEKHHDLRQFLASVGDRSGSESSGMVKEGMTGKELDVFQKQIWQHTYKNHKYIGAELWDALRKRFGRGSSQGVGVSKIRERCRCLGKSIPKQSDCGAARRGRRAGAAPPA